MSLTTQIKPMKLFTTAFGALSTNLGLAVGIATPPEDEAGGVDVNGNHTAHTTTIRSNSSKDPVKGSD